MALRYPILTCGLSGSLVPGSLRQVMSPKSSALVDRAMDRSSVDAPISVDSSESDASPSGPQTVNPNTTPASGIGETYNQSHAQVLPDAMTPWHNVFSPAAPGNAGDSRIQAVQIDTPERRQLREKVVNLESEVRSAQEIAEQHAKVYVEEQHLRFLQVARSFESQARLITQTEVSQNNRANAVVAQTEMNQMLDQFQREIDSNRRWSETSESHLRQRLEMEAENAVGNAIVVLRNENEQAMMMNNVQHQARYDALVQESRDQVQMEAMQMQRLLARLETSENSQRQMEMDNARDTKVRLRQTENLTEALRQAEFQEMHKSSGNTDELRAQLVQQQAEQANLVDTVRKSEREREELHQRQLASMRYEIQQYQALNMSTSSRLDKSEAALELERSNQKDKATTGPAPNTIPEAYDIIPGVSGDQVQRKVDLTNSVNLFRQELADNRQNLWNVIQDPNPGLAARSSGQAAVPGLTAVSQEPLTYHSCNASVKGNEPPVQPTPKAISRSAWMDEVQQWWPSQPRGPPSEASHNSVLPQFYENKTPAPPVKPEERPGPSTSAVKELREDTLPATSNAEASHIKFEAFPDATQFRTWRLNFKIKVASSSKHPKLAFTWINEVDRATDLTQLVDSGHFETLDFKIAAGLNDIMHGEFARKITLIKEKASFHDEMINGRQMAFIIYQHMRTNSVDGALLEFEDLLHVHLHGQNLQKFKTDWEMVLSGQKHLPAEDIMESLFRKQLEKCHALRTLLDMYEHGIVHEGKPKSYFVLESMVNRHLENKRMRKNKEDLQHRRGDPAYPAQGTAAPTTPRGSKKGVCNQWARKGQCAEGENCPRKQSHTKANAPAPRGNSRGREKGKGKGKGKGDSRDRSGSRPRKGKGRGVPLKNRTGRSQNGKHSNALLCRYYVKGQCSQQQNCDYWHLQVCSDYKKGSCPHSHQEQCDFLHTDVRAAGKAHAARERESDLLLQAPKASPRRRRKARPRPKPKARLI